MPYELHIERDGRPFLLDEWKRAVANHPGLRLDGSPVSLRIQETGQEITIAGQEGDIAILIDGEWIRAIHWQRGRPAFNARGVNFKNPSDPVLEAAFYLAEALGAQICGDDGELYERTR